MATNLGAFQTAFNAVPVVYVNPPPEGPMQVPLSVQLTTQDYQQSQSLSLSTLGISQVVALLVSNPANAALQVVAGATSLPFTVPAQGGAIFPVGSTKGNFFLSVAYDAAPATDQTIQIVLYNYPQQPATWAVATQVIQGGLWEVSQSGTWDVNAAQTGAWSVAQNGTWNVGAVQSGNWAVSQSGVWNVSANITNSSVSVTQSGTWNVTASISNAAIAVTQSGGWNVGQTGSWTVGATQSGSWSVGQAGTWNVNSIQSGTWNVAQSGAWNVGPSSGAVFPVSQQGTWNVNAIQQGTWAVSQANTWNVAPASGAVFNVSQNTTWNVNAIQQGTWNVNATGTVAISSGTVNATISNATVQTSAVNTIASVIMKNPRPKLQNITTQTLVTATANTYTQIVPANNRRQEIFITNEGTGTVSITPSDGGYTMGFLTASNTSGDIFTLDQLSGLYKGALWAYANSVTATLQVVEFSQADYSLSGSNAVFGNAPGTLFNLGALEIGQNSSMVLTQANGLPSGPWTLEFWVYASGIPANQTQILGMLSSGGGYACYWGINSSGHNTVLVQIPNLTVSYPGTTSIIKNAWTHIAMVAQNNTTTVYVNGFLDYTFPQAINFTNASKFWIISQAVSTPIVYLNEIAIWGAPRYLSQFTPNGDAYSGQEEGLFALWHLNSNLADSGPGVFLT